MYYYKYTVNYCDLNEGDEDYEKGIVFGNDYADAVEQIIEYYK